MSNYSPTVRVSSPFVGPTFVRVSQAAKNPQVNSVVQLSFLAPHHIMDLCFNNHMRTQAASQHVSHAANDTTNRDKLGINGAVNELMRMKPDRVPVEVWRVIIRSGTVQESTDLLMHNLTDHAQTDRAQVERLVRDAREGNDNDEDVTQQQQAAPEAEIRQNHSMETEDTITTPADLALWETQPQPAGMIWHGFVRFWDRHRPCLFPWTRNPRFITIRPPVNIQPDGQEALAGAFDEPAPVLLDGDVVPGSAPA
eukprot:scaffold6562_cov163-Amphora_coffeaeformis.AAC.4